jgi:hypothetical protein
MLSQIEGNTRSGLTGKGLWIGKKEVGGVWRTFWALARLDEPEPEPA